MAKFGLIETASLNSAWVTAYNAANPDKPISELDIAVAMTMPSLVHGGRGTASKRGGMRAPGKGVLYLATRLAATRAGSTATDADYFSAGAGTSNKTVWVGDLATAGYVVRYGQPRTGMAVTLTPKGIEQVKAVCGGDTARDAKAAHSDTAYQRALKAAAKAARAVMKAEGDDDTPEPVEATSDAPEAEQATYNMSGANPETGVTDDDVRAFVAANGNG